MNKKSKIYIAGHNGMVGSAVLNEFKSNGFKHIIYKSSKELDLRNQNQVNHFISKEKPNLIINAAAVVGGILANDKNPYKFLMDNMLIQNNIIDAAVKNKIENFFFLGSSCIYPKFSKQPIKEEYLLTDSLEQTNQWYAIAKISGVKLIESVRKEYGFNYVSFMPTNLYGPNDNFDPETSHVLPGLISKFHKAKLNNSKFVELWGDGSPLREFLHVNDLSKALFFATSKKLNDSIYNVGSEDEVSIKDLADLISKKTDFKGDIIWNKNFPNGTPRKKIDSSKLNKLGWNPQIRLSEGIDEVYKWYIKNT
ncbi:GDP-L-fucose synthase [Flavobacteriaceae bacterium]|nr:GDP-L-fucose synthase [Flavobacteriaceae bacterium]